MSLLDRVSTLFKADAHGLVDSLEDRRLVLRQCLREAEGELAAKRARRESLGEELRRLEEEGERLSSACERLDADVELALEGGKDELARFSARRLIELRRASEGSLGRREQVAREAAELDERIAGQAAELDALKLRVRSALERAAAADEPTAGSAVAEEEVELELLRRQRRRRGGE